MPSTLKCEPKLTHVDLNAEAIRMARKTVHLIRDPLAAKLLDDLEKLPKNAVCYEERKALFLSSHGMVMATVTGTAEFFAVCAIVAAINHFLEPAGRAAEAGCRAAEALRAAADEQVSLCT